MSEHATKEGMTLNKRMRIILILIAVVCFGVALSYPITEYLQKQATESADDWYEQMMEAGRQKAAANATATVTAAPEETPTPAAEPTSADSKATEPVSDVAAVTEPAAAQATLIPTAPDEQEPAATEPQQGSEEPAATEPQQGSESPAVTEPADEPTEEPTPEPSPEPTPDRRANTGAKIWSEVEKIPLDEDNILPQYQELYAVNHDMVGWLTVVNTSSYGSRISYPVMQTEDDTYYLTRDFQHRDNANGLLILDSHCDAFTPSYNLVVSGHNRWNDTMFYNLTSYYNNKRNWQAHKYVQFDSLMEERTYIVFAAFFAADYDEDEEGFRYNADIQYAVDMNLWLAEVDEYKLYDTGVDVRFGDQVLTLTTCNSSKRKNGRFVVVCRRLREGEAMEW